MQYNCETLVKYCNENKIILLNKYENINRDTYIDFKCACDNNCNKRFRQLIKTGAFCKTCTAKKTSAKISKSFLKNDVTVLNNFCSENNILLTDDYQNISVNRDTVIEGMCITQNCDNKFSRTLRELLKHNGCCANCSKENGKIKIINTCVTKYGVDNPMKNEELYNKQKQTMIIKYGVEHNSQLDSIKEQKKQKSLEKYGVEYVLQSKIIRTAIETTNLIKYGAKNPQQNMEVHNKTNETNLNRYGKKCYFATQEFKEKIKQTNLKKYGVEHHSQNAAVAETMLKHAYNKKSYTLPSGDIIDYQGYENFALDDLLNNENLEEEDIITNRKDVPEIWYNDKNDKRRRHYVDFYIPTQNRCIEVKSTWTNQEKNNIIEKQAAAKEAGYIYDVWIYDRTGKMVNKF
jgi:hypothetical protein